MTTVEHHETFDWINGLFAGRLQRDDLVFYVQWEVFDLFSHIHTVDLIFVSLVVRFWCHVVKLNIFSPGLN